MSLIPRGVQGVLDGIISKPIAQSVAVSEAPLTREQLVVQRQVQAVDKPRPPPVRVVPQRKPAYPAPGLNIVQKFMIGLAVFAVLLIGLIIGSAFLGGGVHYERDLSINPILIAVIVAAAALFGAALGALVELGIWRWRVPEAFLFWRIRHSTNIMHRHIGLQGREVWRAARVDPDGQYLEVQVGDKWVSVSVNPGILGGNKTSYCNGMMIVDTLTNNLMPMSAQDEIALYQLEDYYKNPANGFKVLPHYHKAIVAYLYNCPPGELDEHCALQISVDPSNIDLPYLLKYGYMQLLEVEVKDDSGAIIARRYETPEEMKNRIGKEKVQEIIGKAYSDLCKIVKDNLKGEVVRLKEETRDFYIQEGVFLRYACAEALDSRLATDAKETIERIERNKQNRPAPKEGLPNWIKYTLVFLAGCAGIAIVTYVIAMAIQKLAGG